MNPPMSENFLTPTPETIQAESQPVTGSGKGAHCYRVFGLRIASALPLRNLATLLDTSGADADVNIHITAPEEIPDREGRPQFDVDGNGVTLTMHGTARYRVEAGQRVTVTPHHSASERKIVLFLLGSVIGIICHQRRLMPLHASAILVNGRAIAFCGHSGIGKSTLVSHLAARGHAMLCDDVCVVSLDATHRPHAFPGLPTARLWRDAAEQLGYDCGTLDLVVDDRDKYHTPRPAIGTSGPFPLDRIYMISDGRGNDEPPFVPLKGVHAVQTLMNETYRKVYLDPMGLFGANVAQATQIARHAQLFTMHRRHGYDVLAAEIDLLEDHLEQP